MDLVSLEFRVLARRRETDDFAISIHVTGKLIAFFNGKAEKFLEHSDHIVVGMIVVIPQNDMIPWLAFRRSACCFSFVVASGWAVAEAAFMNRPSDSWYGDF